MSNHRTIFSSAEILLPKFAADSEKMQRWAVIACDQFTSEREYWNRCRDLVNGEPSTYQYILPEAYLETEEEARHAALVKNSMNTFSRDFMQTIDGLIYVERTLPNGTVRHGIVGKIDLEEYDYSVGSTSAIRATEATVVERIPPRCKVRADAVIEFPHILILIDDKNGVFSSAAERKSSCNVAYDFDLMLGGGHITGYAVTGENLTALTEKIAEYEASASGVVYAMGDGNHSLAAAKAHWENVKRETGDMTHPARYALCEITALGDESLVFEPIYRVIKNCDKADFLGALEAITEEGSGEQSVTILSGETKSTCHFTAPEHAMTVGSLQIFLDRYLKSHPGVVCDYIHGEDSLEKLSKEPGSIGFLYDGMDKNELFGYVGAHGTLPRKTFSMGEAESKRYYLDARVIVK